MPGPAAGPAHAGAVLVDALGRRTRLRERRLVSMADPHLAALEVALTPCNWAGRLEVRSLVDGGVTNRNVPAYRALAGRHLGVCRLWHDGPVACVAVETVQSRVRVVVAARTLLRSAAGAPADAAGGAVAVAGGATAGHELAVDLDEGEEVVVEKTVGVATSRDLAISEASVAAVRTARAAPAFGEVLAAHASAWAGLWRRFGLDLDGDAWAARAVRVHLVQLLQALSPNTTDLDVGVPARGLHGEAYRGHVFWDELFVFPLLDLRFPELTRSLAPAPRPESRRGAVGADRASRGRAPTVGAGRSRPHGAVPAQRAARPVRRLRRPRRARLGRLPPALRRHRPARPDPRRGGRLDQPLPGLQAGPTP